jgi:hypothetical protein
MRPPAARSRHLAPVDGAGLPVSDRPSSSRPRREKKRKRRSGDRAASDALVVRPVPVPVGAHHPAVPHDSVLPQHEFTAGLIAPKGSGKTTLIANVLRFFRGYFHTVVVFSPTLHADEKWDYIRSLPLLAENVDLRKFLEKRSANRDDAVVGSRSAVVGRRKPFDPRIPDEHLMADYDEETLRSLMREQLDQIEAVERLGGTKHLANRILFVFDDLVGSNLFSGRRDNPFKVLNTTHRHHSASILMVSQAYKEIPKTVRTNWTCLFLFEIPNEAEVEVVYRENPVGLKRDQWDRVYRHCTEGEFDFMYLNSKRPKRLRVMKNFGQFVWIEKGEE